MFSPFLVSIYDKSNELEQMLYFCNRLRSETAGIGAADATMASVSSDNAANRPLAEAS